MLRPDRPALIHVVGGGPAGATAALAALANACPVRLFEKSKFPRHKVCGEFLSPEIAEPLSRLNLWNPILALEPPKIRRMLLHFGRSSKAGTLPEPAFGLSRYALDQLLLSTAVARGAVICGDNVPQESESAPQPLIVATGRQDRAARGTRIFGFKAHFTGPVDDAIELFFFFGDAYVGINTVEGGVTNVCGLAPENALARVGFDIDQFVHSSEPLRERLAPLRRKMKWLVVGPLVFRQHFAQAARAGLYPCGDALSFVDPFTGSGLLSAIVTGALAGESAARGIAAAEYLAQCRERLEKPFAVSSVFRSIARRRWAGAIAAVTPAKLLFRWTRPAAENRMGSG